ncbi:MAG: 50S ribosomal protein L11 methyltransferase [Thermoanaerobacteraceae bacterium]|nr:50S ribosomal protein L11 methyltransferase [Thermoanaerobacteraceae bacterium]
MKWLEVQVTTTVEAEEAVTNIMHEFGASGVVIKDPNDIRLLADESKWDYIDPKLLEDGNSVKISAYFPVLPDIINKVRIIEEKVLGLREFNLDIGDFDLEVSEVDEKDWENNWKKYYKPIKIGEKIVIKPSWEKYNPDANEIIVELDPGMAFGTGTHETTKMCIEYLEKCVKKGDTVFDVGCGSGILSIVSSKLNAGKVLAADIDEVAIKVAYENVMLNKADNVKIFKSDLLSNFIGNADIIVSNIIADVIIKIAEDVSKHLINNGIYISSGIIKDRKDDVLLVLSKYFDILDIKENGEWVAILSRKK